MDSNKVAELTNSKAIKSNEGNVGGHRHLISFIILKILNITLSTLPVKIIALLFLSVGASSNCIFEYAFQSFLKNPNIKNLE